MVLVKKLIIITLIILLFATAGCIKIKDPNCEANPQGADLTENTDLTNNPDGAGSDQPDTQDTENPIKEDVRVVEKNPVTEFELTEQEKALPLKEVMEGEQVNFPNLEAKDPDGDTITYTFTAPLDSKGEWQTQQGDAGKYHVIITASDGKNKVEQEVLILVKSANKAPVILAEDIVVTEGDVINFEPSVTDADGDSVRVEVNGWKTDFPYQTNFEDSGTHYVTVTATDGKETVSKDVKMIVKNQNRAPMFEPIDDIVIKEYDKITLRPKAQDPDGDEITFEYTEPLNNFGDWKTEKGDAGKYEVTITASDGELSDQQTIMIIVESSNEAPIIGGAADMTVKEGETVELGITAEDPEGKEVTITYSGWMTSDTKEVGYDEEGTHEVVVTASDGEMVSKKTIQITVEDVNRAPVFGQDAFA